MPRQTKSPKKTNKKPTYKKPTKSKSKSKSIINLEDVQLVEKNQESVTNNPRCCDEDGPCECMVCLDEKPLLELKPCTHYVCGQCIMRLTICPLCRAPIQNVGCNQQYQSLHDFKQNNVANYPIHTDVVNRRPVIERVINFEVVHDDEINRTVRELLIRLEMTHRSDIHLIIRDVRHLVLLLCSKTSPYDVRNAYNFTAEYEHYSQLVIRLFNERYRKRRYFGVTTRRLTCGERNIIYQILANFVNEIKEYEAIDPSIVPLCSIMGGRKTMSNKKRKGKSKKRM